MNRSSLLKLSFLLIRKTGLNGRVAKLFKRSNKLAPNGNVCVCWIVDLDRKCYGSGGKLKQTIGDTTGRL